MVGFLFLSYLTFVQDRPKFPQGLHTKGTYQKATLTEAIVEDAHAAFSGLVSLENDKVMQCFVLFDIIRRLRQQLSLTSAELDLLESASNQYGFFA
jgi:hypothetical protein